MSERVFRVTRATGYTGPCECPACTASRGASVRHAAPPAPRVQPPAAPDLAARIAAERARLAQTASESWSEKLSRVAAIFGIRQAK
jgi:hypothetical protein